MAQGSNAATKAARTPKIDLNPRLEPQRELPAAGRPIEVEEIARALKRLETRKKSPLSTSTNRTARAILGTKTRHGQFVIDPVSGRCDLSVEAVRDRVRVGNRKVSRSQIFESLRELEELGLIRRTLVDPRFADCTHTEVPGWPGFRVCLALRASLAARGLHVTCVAHHGRTILHWLPATLDAVRERLRGAPDRRIRRAQSGSSKRSASGCSEASPQTGPRGGAAETPQTASSDWTPYPAPLLRSVTDPSPPPPGSVAHARERQDPSLKRAATEGPAAPSLVPPGAGPAGPGPHASMASRPAIPGGGSEMIGSEGEKSTVRTRTEGVVGDAARTAPPASQPDPEPVLARAGGWSTTDPDAASAFRVLEFYRRTWTPDFRGEAPTPHQLGEIRVGFSYGHNEARLCLAIAQSKRRPENEPLERHTLRALMQPATLDSLLGMACSASSDAPPRRSRSSSATDGDDERLEHARRMREGSKPPPRGSPSWTPSAPPPAPKAAPPAKPDPAELAALERVPGWADATPSVLSAPPAPKPIAPLLSREEHAKRVRDQAARLELLELEAKKPKGEP